MGSTRRWRLASALAVVLAVTACGPNDPEPTNAEPTNAEPTNVEPTDAESTDAESTDARVDVSWSMPAGAPDVLGAQVLDGLVAADSGFVADDPGTLILPPSDAGFDVGGMPWPVADTSTTLLHGAPLLHSTVGQLRFLNADGVEEGCSATVVQSPTDDVLVTAAHCVLDAATGTWSTDMRFVPGAFSAEGDAPFGEWLVVDRAVPQAYVDDAGVTDGSAASGPGTAFDVAFLRVALNADGDAIEDVVGAQGISFVGETSSVAVLGYPVVAPFTGDELRACVSDDVEAAGWRPQLRIACDLTGGASGGPWLTGVGEDAGAGFVVAVYSAYGTGDGRWVTGAVLGEDLQALFEAFVA